MLFYKNILCILQFICSREENTNNFLFENYLMRDFEVDKNYIINLLQKEDDSTLIEQINKKDFNAYIALYLKYSGYLKKVINNITKNSEITDDLYQELYLKVIKWKKYHKLRSPGVFVEMAKNLSFTYYKKHKKSHKHTNNEFILNSVADDTVNNSNTEAIIFDCELIRDMIKAFKSEITDVNNTNNLNNDIIELKNTLLALQDSDIFKIKHLFETIATSIDSFNNGDSKIVYEVLYCLFKHGLSDFRSYYDKYINFKKYKELISLYYKDNNTSETLLRQRHCRMNKEICKIVNKFNGVCDET